MMEDRVRGMLRERAGDITTVPPALLALGAPPRRPRRLLVALAAAAVVLAIAGIVLAVRGQSNDRTPVGGTCTTDLPAQWRDALTEVELGRPAAVLAVLGDGSLLVRSYDSVDSAGMNELRTLDLITPAGQRRNLFAYGTDQYEVLTAYPVGRTQFVLVGQDAGFAMVGGEHPIPPRPVYGIELIDAATRIQHALARSDDTAVIGGVAMLGDTVFWDVHADQTTRAGEVRAHDISADRTRTEYSGDIVGQVTGTATTVTWGSGEIQADLPPDTLAALGADAVTDGTAYASAADSEIAWAGADGTVRRIDQHVADTALVRAVAGAVVFFTAYDSSDELYALDTRTRAVADLGINFPGQAFADDGVVAFAGAPDSTTTPGPAIRADANGLPELEC